MKTEMEDKMIDGDSFGDILVLDHINAVAAVKLYTELNWHFVTQNDFMSYHSSHIHGVLELRTVQKKQCMFPKRPERPCRKKAGGGESFMCSLAFFILYFLPVSYTIATPMQVVCQMLFNLCLLTTLPKWFLML